MKKLIAIATTALMLPLSSQAAPLDSEQQQQVKTLVHEALLEKPEIFIEMIDKLKKKEQAAKEKAQSAALSKNQAELFDKPEDPFSGSENPTLSIVYFGDVNCGFCKKLEPILDKMLQEHPEIKVIYKDLPILGPSSDESAVMSLVARAMAEDDQGNEAYLKLHKAFMEQSARHDSDSIANIVKAQGYDIEKLREGVKDEISQQLNSNIALAQKLGITGTPTLVFKDKVVGGFTNEESLKAIIEERLQSQ